MNDLDKLRTEKDSRRRAAELGHATRYSEAVDRYLGAAAYRLGEPEPAASPAPARTNTGVVLVGVDETPTSYTALDHAAIEAELHGWDLRVLHVQRPGLRRPSRDTGDRLLERLTDRVRAYSPSVAVTSRLVVGSPARTLLAEGKTATLVVVGHRHNPAGAAFGVSVGDRVAAQHTGPVLVVRVPGWPPGPEFGRRPLVVGADEPGLSTPAARFALVEARTRGCELIVVHAGTDIAPARLETSGGVRVQHRTVAADPATTLLGLSGRAAAVVLGRRLGSVSRTMLQRAYCPVFLVG